MHSQFIIATHSPLIMAYPDSVIYEFGKDGIKKVTYEKTEQYAVYRSFFSDHRRFFYEIYKEAQKGKKNFHLIDLRQLYHGYSQADWLDGD